MSDHGSVPPPGQEPYGQQPPPGWQPYGQQPPPGWQPPAGPPYPQQPHPQQPPGPGWQPGPGMLGAAHKPGAVPLRPLGLGDMFDGAFRIIRFNPRATVGGALLVAVVAMAVPLVVTSLLTASFGTTVDPLTGQADAGSSVGFRASVASQAVGFLLLQVGLLLVTGLIAHVTHQAAIGRRIGLGEAWSMTRGRRWRLVGLVLLVALAYGLAYGLWVASIAGLVVAGTGTALVVGYGVLSGLLLVVVSVFLYVRVVLLATPALVLERLGIGSALARSWRLSRQQFWRVLGIALVTSIVVGIAGFVVALPVEIGTQVLAFATPENALLIGVAGQAVGTVLSTAFTSPFTAVVTTLQYLDQRMRKEAHDVTLMSEAGITGA
ncbi:glycerophosphoryl diester phosphodiesterase membrane domain-containing protein [Nocardioides sp. AX2bis]|uniref:glycerophosphoryl diester phosphodiesterase membrane domain-containing protein n=1 Tax=Nocardioides sp. AX2bis TaxID=2653157 RepID=UPI0012EFFEA9|nr:hypothetical protein [Nocardioides sp. AX2bis]VXA97880.1 conserved membrane hypothetical protein [Nocardioides sp. AX2bis]